MIFDWGSRLAVVVIEDLGTKVFVRDLDDITAGSRLALASDINLAQTEGKSLAARSHKRVEPDANESATDAHVGAVEFERGSDVPNMVAGDAGKFTAPAEG